MKVLLVSHRYPPDAIAGVERYTQAVAGGLMESGDQVSVVTRRPASLPREPEILTERLPGGLDLYRLVGGSINRPRFLAGHERLDELFETVLLRTGPDVVHINHLIDLSPRFIAIAHVHRAALVLSLHDYYFACPKIILTKPSGELCAGPAGGRECARTCFAHEGALRSVRWALRTLYFQRLLAIPERLVFPSRDVASRFLGFGVPSERVRVIPNGVWTRPDQTPTTPYIEPAHQRPLRLAFLGAVLPHKGLHVVLRALSIARLPSVEVMVFGPSEDIPYRDALHAEAARLPGVTLRLFGGYEPDELPQILRGSDCVIVPSQWPETFGLVAREALANGIPVLASRLGALPETIIEGDNGFTFDPNLPEELASILRRLIDEPGLLSRLHFGAGRTRITTMAEHVTFLRQVYEEALIDMANTQSARSDPGDELDFLRDALQDTGFGEAKPPAIQGGAPNMRDGDKRRGTSFGTKSSA